MMKQNIFALKGHICYSQSLDKISVNEDSFIICEDGISRGVFKTLPEQYTGIPVKDYGDRMIIPGLTDLHLHAPQYTFRSIGMDMELLEWLNTHTFPEEARYADENYARSAYHFFAQELRKSATTRACMFGTIHVPATMVLMEEMEASGLISYVGKVNMDRNSPDYLCEENAEASAKATLSWLSQCKERFSRVKPVITPRFVPSCTDGLMRELGQIAAEGHYPVQSHLSENYSEIEWVHELNPASEFYGDAYDMFGLFGRPVPTIMAHCVHSSPEEIQRMKDNHVFIAHCAQSNACLASGIAPVRTYLNEGLHVGLGSDIAGGYDLSIFKAMAEAVNASKLRWRLCDQSLTPLSVEEVFYLATKGGGAFFGKVGSFEAGYEMDAVVIDDALLWHPQPMSVRERWERAIYLSDDRHIAGKYVAGTQIF